MGKAWVKWLSSAGLRGVGEACCFGRLLRGWGITRGDRVRYGQTDPGDRTSGKPAEGKMSVSRLRVLERGLKYRRSLQPGSPQSLLNPGYFTPANHDLRGLYPCNGYDEVAVLILDFQYPRAFFKHCQGPSQLSEKCSAECPSPIQNTEAELQNVLYFLMTKM